MKVLIVEDSPGDLRLIREWLADGGNAVAEIQCARNLAEGLDCLAHTAPDVMLLDLGLPDSQGLDTVTRARATAPGVPIVVLTGLDDDSVRLAAVQVGAQDYLPKAHADGRSLTRAIRHAIERHELAGELERRSVELAATSKRIQEMIDANADGMIIVDENGLLRFLNPAAEMLLGRKAEQLIGTPFGHTIAPGETMEADLVRKNGESLTVGMRAVPHPWQGQDAYLISLHDITQRKRGAEALRQALEESRRRQAEVSALLAGSRLVLEDRDFPRVARSAFDACRELTGATAGYVALLTDDGLEDSVLSLETGGLPCTVDPSLLKPIRGLRAEACSSGQPVYQNDFGHSQCAGDMPTGHLALDNALFAPPIIQGETVGLLGLANKPAGFTQDDAEIARAFAELAAISLMSNRTRQSLEASQRRYRSLFDEMPVGLYQTHADGRILEVNPALVELLGYPDRETLLAQDAVDGYSDRKARQQWRAQLEREGEVRGRKSQWVRYDGSRVWVQENARVVRGADGQPLYYEGTVEDISSQRQMEEQLRHAHKMESVGRLAGGVAYDFNNLLTVIMGFACFARDALPGDSPMRRDLAEVLKASDRAARLTGQLLAFSRRQVLEPQVVDPNDLVLSMDKMLRRLIAEHIEYVTIVDPEIGHIRVDPGQIEQVVVNLAVNASDAMPDGGTLTITTCNATLDDKKLIHPGMGAPPGEFVMLSVSDTGVGIPSEIKEHLFEPFFTTKPPGKGTGLGLAMVYGIVKQHGGEIAVESEVGEGTTFRIYFPRVHGPVQERPSQSLGEASPCGRGERILVVEDESSVRMLAVRTLRRQGYEVLEAANGEDGLRLLNDQGGAVDLVITDLVMPLMNGMQLADRVRAQDSDARVLFMTGYTDVDAQLHDVNDPHTSLLRKPFGTEALATKVRELLDAAI